MNTSKKITLILLFISLLAVSYLYISKSTNVDAADENNGPLSSSSGSNVMGNQSSDQIASDIAFLSTLTTLKNIKIDTALFKSDLFNALSDNAVSLPVIPPGRPNPFASIGLTIETKTPTTITENTPSLTAQVVTNDATKVTTKTAVLNALVNTTLSNTVSYFEFGTTISLENKTPQVIRTLVGTYATNVTGLQSKTTYYFRAASVIGGQTLYGEVKSFTTN